MSAARIRWSVPTKRDEECDEEVAQPPPALPTRKPRCALTCVAATCCFCFYSMLLIEMPALKFGSEDELSRRRLRDPQQLVEFGLWDELLTISRLQLTVVIAMSLKTDEETVGVVALEDHFFFIRVLEGEWLVAAINEDDRLLARINRNAWIFGAKLVISHPARLSLNDTR